MAKNVLLMLKQALARNNETIDDIIQISIPLEILNEIATLEEIHCYYLYIQSENQDIPLIAFTKSHVYYYDKDTEIRIKVPLGTSTTPPYSNVDFIPGVDSWAIPASSHIDPYRIETIEAKAKTTGI